MLGLLFSSGTRGLSRGNKFSPLATSSPCSTFSFSSSAAAALALHILPTVFLRLMFRLRDSPLCLHTAFKRYFHAPPQPPARGYRSSIVSLRTHWCQRARTSVATIAASAKEISRLPFHSLFGVFILFLVINRRSSYDTIEKRKAFAVCGYFHGVLTPMNLELQR